MVRWKDELWILFLFNFFTEMKGYPFHYFWLIVLLEIQPTLAAVLTKKPKLLVLFQDAKKTFRLNLSTVTCCVPCQRSHVNGRMSTVTCQQSRVKSHMSLHGLNLYIYIGFIFTSTLNRHKSVPPSIGVVRLFLGTDLGVAVKPSFFIIDLILSNSAMISSLYLVTFILYFIERSWGEIIRWISIGWSFHKYG